MTGEVSRDLSGRIRDRLERVELLEPGGNRAGPVSVDQRPQPPAAVCARRVRRAAAAPGGARVGPAVRSAARVAAKISALIWHVAWSSSPYIDCPDRLCELVTVSSRAVPPGTLRPPRRAGSLRLCPSVAPADRSARGRLPRWWGCARRQVPGRPRVARR